jgi:hypothetical protein
MDHEHQHVSTRLLFDEAVGKAPNEPSGSLLRAHLRVRAAVLRRRLFPAGSDARSAGRSRRGDAQVAFKHVAAMRVAALYDIHANIPALDAVLAAVGRAGVETIVVGGDVVPGPMPVETIECLRALG